MSRSPKEKATGEPFLPWTDSLRIDPAGVDSPNLRGAAENEVKARSRYSVPPALEPDEQYAVTLNAVQRWFERNVRPKG